MSELGSVQSQFQLQFAVHFFAALPLTLAVPLSLALSLYLSLAEYVNQLFRQATFEGLPRVFFRAAAW